jgi:hypothetical protein
MGGRLSGSSRVYGPARWRRAIAAMIWDKTITRELDGITMNQDLSTWRYQVLCILFPSALGSELDRYHRNGARPNRAVTCAGHDHPRLSWVVPAYMRRAWLANGATLLHI